MKGNRKKYVAELIRMLATYQMDRVSFNHVLKAMRLYKVSVVDEKIYEIWIIHSTSIADVTGSDSFCWEAAGWHFAGRQQLSRSLYRLATNPTQSEFDTITEVKDIQAKHPDKDAMSYYELVIIFQAFYIRQTICEKYWLPVIYLWICFINLLSNTTKKPYVTWMNWNRKLRKVKMAWQNPGNKRPLGTACTTLEHKNTHQKRV